MKRRNLIVLVAAVTGLLLMASYSPAIAQQPPHDGCAAVPKIQYDSAKKHYLLYGRFGVYVKTGPIWRRRYWYCH